MKPKDLTHIGEQFQEASKPLIDLVQSKLNRLPEVNSKAMPHILKEIEVISEAITALEAVFGVLMNEYCHLTDGYLYCRRQIETLRTSLHWYINEMQNETGLSYDRYFERIEKQIKHENNAGRPQQSA